MTQMSFGSSEWALKGKVTRREQFLAEMDAVIPWSRLLALIEPHYPRAATGRPPHRWSGCCGSTSCSSGSTCRTRRRRIAIYDSESMRRFARVELGDDMIPDESTILRFRHLLEQHKLTEAIFEAGEGPAGEHRLAASGGDDRGCDDHRRAALDEERDGERDPEMKQTRKGKTGTSG